MDSLKSFSIAVTGLGGQGILLLSKSISNAAMTEFPFVCRTESRGLSQRGGSVQSMVRFAHQPITGIIEEGGADLVISLELLESARSIPLLKKGGVLIGSDNFTPPAHLADRWNSLKNANAETEFKKHLARLLENRTGTYSIDASAIASTVRCTKAANVALLGAASVFVPLSQVKLKSALLLNLKSEFRSANELAFDAGRDALLALIENRFSA